MDAHPHHKIIIALRKYLPQLVQFRPSGSKVIFREGIMFHKGLPEVQIDILRINRQGPKPGFASPFKLEIR